MYFLAAKAYTGLSPVRARPLHACIKIRSVLKISSETG